MRGRLAADCAAVAARGWKANGLLHSSSAATFLGSNLPDVWTVATASSRFTASANCGLAQQRPAKILDGNSMARKIRSGIACELDDEEEPVKDVDGFHPMNTGNLVMRGGSHSSSLVRRGVVSKHHATGSTVRAFTKNPYQITRQGIVVADVGIPNIVCGCWLRPGAVSVGKVTISPLLSNTLDSAKRAIEDPRKH
ncbi:hypothetical protein MLD38_025423 [Melastoma candidum]|uniref:Uncharacterized protein n=1 Tax=Melastoma candidum TaxID=119954 RepID=A0ACB9NV98_9MYRT|nr:hypothetical protein MLD38_025423 [Melastoma candidum]